MAAIDVTSVVTDIAAQAAPVALIGGAVLLLLVAIKAFHWLRAVLQGGDGGDYDDNRAADWERDGGGMIEHNDDGSTTTTYSNTGRVERS